MHAFDITAKPPKSEGIKCTEKVYTQRLRSFRDLSDYDYT